MDNVMVAKDQTQIWLEEAKSGDQLAISKLLAIYHPMLRARADSRLDRHLKAAIEAEDILQQVYIQVIREFSSFQDRGPNSFLNWVFTILDNKLIDVRRAAHRQRRDVARNIPAAGGTKVESYWNLFDQLNADDGTPSRFVRRDEALGALLACVSNLPEAYRRVIQLRFLEGRPVAEVAQLLDKSEAAVVALSKRALDALRKSMDGLGEFTRGC